jgi:hypothetical protein
MARYAGKAFSIGLSFDGEEKWVAHVHHGPFAWIQRVTPSGRRARHALIRAFERALASAGATSMQWFEERDINLRHASATSSTD